MKKKKLIVEVATPISEEKAQKLIDEINEKFKRLYSSPKKG